MRGLARLMRHDVMCSVIERFGVSNRGIIIVGRAAPTPIYVSWQTQQRHD